MKQLLTLTLSLLFTLTATAGEQITIKTKIIESDKAIPEDITKLATSEGVSILSTPSVTTRSGQQAQIEIIREVIPPTFLSGDPSTVNTGTILGITPKLEDGQISFTAHLTLREQVDANPKEAPSQIEFITRELYISGTAKDGEPVWFHFTEPKDGKKVAMCLQFERAAGE